MRGSEQDVADFRFHVKHIDIIHLATVFPSMCVLHIIEYINQKMLQIASSFQCVTDNSYSLP